MYYFLLCQNGINLFEERYFLALENNPKNFKVIIPFTLLPEIYVFQLFFILVKI
jgi:hypothetical protein